MPRCWHDAQPAAVCCSETLVVDDEYVSISSANLNQRSLDGSRDTELGMGAWQVSAGGLAMKPWGAWSVQAAIDQGCLCWQRAAPATQDCAGGERTAGLSYGTAGTCCTLQTACTTGSSLSRLRAASGLLLQPVEAALLGSLLHSTGLVEQGCPCCLAGSSRERHVQPEAADRGHMRAQRMTSQGARLTRAAAACSPPTCWRAPRRAALAGAGRSRVPRIWRSTQRIP